ncbi:hypothetical protein FB451DRAFT_1449155 [Mycena latifolia]|nr:hypothetical protein FB451DRAFT_1449155 [Mycena latifolia]
MPQLPGYPSYDILTDVKIYAADEVQDRIAVTFSKLRTIYGAQFHLFHVIDEAQVISREHTSAFQHQGKPYPLLWEIIQSWSSKSAPHETSFVILGTDIPQDGFPFASFPASVRWCSDTGSFDDEADHPPVLITIHDTHLRSVTRGPNVPAARRSRGHGVVADALVKALLLDALRTPHKLLNDYIEKVTTYRPTDYIDDERFRYPIHVGVQELRPYFFSHSPPLKSTVQQVLFHYLATARHPSPFSEELIPLVSAGFGHFIDSNANQVVMDDLCSSSELRDGSAELVAFDGKDASVIDESSFPAALIASPSILGGVEAWLDDPEGAAFCLIHTRDPDFIFVLKLADGRFLRVILRPIVTEAILKNDPLRKVMTRLDPKNLFRDEANVPQLHHSLPANKQPSGQT